MSTEGRSKKRMTRIDEIIPRIPTESIISPEIITLECGHHVYKTAYSTDKKCHLCDIEGENPWPFVRTDQLEKRPKRIK